MGVRSIDDVTGSNKITTSPTGRGKGKSGLRSDHLAQGTPSTGQMDNWGRFGLRIMGVAFEL